MSLKQHQLSKAEQLAGDVEYFDEKEHECWKCKETKSTYLAYRPLNCIGNRLCMPCLKLIETEGSWNQYLFTWQQLDVMQKLTAINPALGSSSEQKVLFFEI